MVNLVRMASHVHVDAEQLTLGLMSRYCYQLEAVVDKVCGRTPHAWISGEYSLAQMRVVEMVYEMVLYHFFPSSFCEMNYLFMIMLGLPSHPKLDYVA